VNLRHPILGNKAVRKAIAFAIDRDVIVKLALSGRGRWRPARSAPTTSRSTPRRAEISARHGAGQQAARRGRLPAQSNGTRFSIKLTYEGAGEGGALQAAARSCAKSFARSASTCSSSPPMRRGGWIRFRN